MAMDLCFNMLPFSRPFSSSAFGVSAHRRPIFARSSSSTQEPTSIASLSLNNNNGFSGPFLHSLLGSPSYHRLFPLIEWVFMNGPPSEYATIERHLEFAFAELL